MAARLPILLALALLAAAAAPARAAQCEDLCDNMRDHQFGLCCDYKVASSCDKQDRSGLVTRGQCYEVCACNMFGCGTVPRSIHACSQPAATHALPPAAQVELRKVL